MAEPVIAVVIPCFRVRKAILGTLARIGDEVRYIFVVDDACPEQSGRHVEQHNQDSRVTVLHHRTNQGVGGAVISGYRAALEVGADIVVKIDGDGQMDPALLPAFVAPLLSGECDYAKGNRFHSLQGVRSMPRVRFLGNLVLSFVTKMSSGYWRVFDPTNGYTAIHRAALCRLNLETLSRRYFFESDMLVKLGEAGAVVADVPMEAVYGDERSSLRVRDVAFEFLFKHARFFVRRILYNYFFRDFNIASLFLVFGLLLMGFGTVFGAIEWIHSIRTQQPATAGTVMLATLPVILGFQLLLGFLNYDISNEPKRTLQSQKGVAARLPADPGPGGAP